MDRIPDYSGFLKCETGGHVMNIYMPSLKRQVGFSMMTVSDVKTITRTGIVQGFDIMNMYLYLSLFDKLRIHPFSQCGLDSSTITVLDYLAFVFRNKEADEQLDDIPVRMP